MQQTELSLLIGVEIGEEEWLMDTEENIDKELSWLMMENFIHYER